MDREEYATFLEGLVDHLQSCREEMPPVARLSPSIEAMRSDIIESEARLNLLAACLRWKAEDWE